MICRPYRAILMSILISVASGLAACTGNDSEDRYLVSVVAHCDRENLIPATPVLVIWNDGLFIAGAKDICNSEPCDSFAIGFADPGWVRTASSKLMSGSEVVLNGFQEKNLIAPDEPHYEIMWPSGKVVRWSDSSSGTAVAHLNQLLIELIDSRAVSSQVQPNPLAVKSAVARLDAMPALLEWIEVCLPE